jgi:hypothetical protein
MFSRKTQVIAGISALVASGGLATALTAGTASAATVNTPRPVPHACAYNLNGGNVLDLVFQGTTFKYPILLHVGNNGVINGLLLDTGLPAGHQVLKVNGLCVRDNVILDDNYPVAGPQGSRAEDLVLTPVPGHSYRATVGGDWTETGPEQGNGTASFENVVFRY